MNARDIEATARHLAASRWRIREKLAVAVICVIAAVVLVPLAPQAAVAFGAGAMVAVVAACLAAVARRDRIARLALDPLAHELSEVARYAQRLTRRFERERLAGWIVEILDEAGRIPESLYLTRRVVGCAEELAALSRDIADPAMHIRPASAAALRVLLTQAVDSPLYNPGLPDDQLPATLAKIRMGISRSAA